MELTATKPTIDIWFDYICPFSVMTRKVIDDVTARTPADVRWHPYELHENGVPPTGKTDYPEHVWENSVLPMAERLGVRFGPVPAIALPRTALAMHGHRYAQEHGLGPAWDTRVFDAHFHRARDISDPAELTATAGDLGLDTEEFRARILSPQAALEHHDSQQHTRRALRIHTVPTVAIGSWRTEGVPQAARLLDVIAALSTRRPTRT
jgi:predicted DsbA family dithiol-disulfide isomerase